MDLTTLKTDRQRQILKKLGERLIEMAASGDAEDVEVTLEYIQDGYLDLLEGDDFFGTEGWAHWLGLD